MVSDPATSSKLLDVSAGNPIVVTGCAGFIGYHLSRQLLDAGIDVLGLDSLTAYYDVSLKESRLQQLENPGFEFRKIDIADPKAVKDLFMEVEPRLVIHLAAQPGVRYSLVNPHAYSQSNLVGSLNVLEACRHVETRHLVFASSSSVYGNNKKIPFSIKDNVDHPISLYAATKKSCELMAHAYSHLYKLPMTGLRFFTVYGPWGRPDMAYFIFTKAILEGATIKVFNNGDMRRDFTYIDDIIEGVLRVCARPPELRPGSTAPFRLYNIGNSNPENLVDMIEILEKHLGKKATREYLPMQAGDVEATFADTSDLEKEIGFRPGTSLEVGLKKFVDWYKEFYGEKAT